MVSELPGESGAPIPVKIFGLQRTGTNLSAALLAKNFHVEVLGEGTGWKHGRVLRLPARRNGEAVRFVVCVRDPYSWLVSCYRYFKKAFGRDKTLPVGFSPLMSFDLWVTRSSYEFLSPTDRWNRMNRHWLERLPASRTAVVRHEELLVDQPAVMERIGSELGLVPRLACGFRSILRRVDVIDQGAPVNRDYYLKRGFLSEYTRPVCGLVSGELDRKLMGRLGYTLAGVEEGASIARPAAPPGAAGPSAEQAKACADTVGRGGASVTRLNRRGAFAAAKACIESTAPYPADRFEGKGIVICAGGPVYFPCAWVCVNMLRRLGVGLPVELWALDANELDRKMRDLLRPLGVRCVNAAVVRETHPVRILGGWELKAYAVLHSRFREVLFLDADNVPVRDPSFLFRCRPYTDPGALFWPCTSMLSPHHAIWQICRVPYRAEPDFETGQMLIDKARCWRALNLTMHLNENSDFYYKYIYGDKDTFHMAWRMLDQEYGMITTPLQAMGAYLRQHDPRGRLLFQHRHGAKWKVDAPNQVVPGFKFEDVCFGYLDRLYSRWDGRTGGAMYPTTRSGHVTDPASAFGSDT